MFPDLIYDVGMNNGDDTAYYLSRGYKVIAIEADPILAKAGAQRFAAEIAAGRLKILNVGVSDHDGESPFWICEANSDWSSFHRDIASREGSPHHEVLIPCRRIASIVAEHGVPFYLKTDIEGNDMLCLQGLPDGDLPKYVSLEAAVANPLTHLTSAGYSGFKCISQRNFLPLQIPPCDEQIRWEGALENLYSRNIFMRALRALGAKWLWHRQLDKSRTRGSWKFPWGSSGPFGEDLPGRWQSADEMRKTYRSFDELCRNGAPGIFWDDKEYSFWVDLHARRD